MQKNIINKTTVIIRKAAYYGMHFFSFSKEFFSKDQKYFVLCISFDKLIFIIYESKNKLTNGLIF